MWLDGLMPQPHLLLEISSWEKKGKAETRKVRGAGLPCKKGGEDGNWQGIMKRQTTPTEKRRNSPSSPGRCFRGRKSEVKSQAGLLGRY